jgi:hypothetical protein
MYQTRNSYDFQQPAADERSQSRLNWLLSVNQWEAKRQRLFRHEIEEEEMLLMRHPLPLRKAYGLFGLLLGTFPPAAIFIRLFGYTVSTGHGNYLGDTGLFVVMNAICAMMGYCMGSALAAKIGKLERGSWIKMFLLSPLMGLAWAIPTGAVGGVLVIVIGSIFGAIMATPVGLLAFSLFMPLHRLLARGGMIDARHFWPVACGLVLMISALILGM